MWKSQSFIIIILLVKTKNLPKSHSHNPDRKVKFEEKDIKLCCHTVWLETFLAQKLTHDSKKALVFFVFLLSLKLTELPGFVG